VQGSQHDDPSRDARQLPSGVILSRGTGDLGSVPSHATTPEVVEGPRFAPHLTLKYRCWVRPQVNFWLLRIVDNSASICISQI
jgi:hypothetical protein